MKMIFQRQRSIVLIERNIFQANNNWENFQENSFNIVRWNEKLKKGQKKKHIFSASNYTFFTSAHSQIESRMENRCLIANKRKRRKIRRRNETQTNTKTSEKNVTKSKQIACRCCSVTQSETQLWFSFIVNIIVACHVRSLSPNVTILLCCYKNNGKIWYWVSNSRDSFRFFERREIDMSPQSPSSLKSSHVRLFIGSLPLY